MSKAYKCDRCGAVFSKRDEYSGKGGIYAEPLKLEFHVIGVKYAGFSSGNSAPNAARGSTSL